jgi:hypothetical protein
MEGRGVAGNCAVRSFGEAHDRASGSSEMGSKTIKSRFELPNRPIDQNDELAGRTAPEDDLHEMGAGGEEPTTEEDYFDSGDPDVDALDAEFSGEEVPGGANSAPDQNDVDDIGALYGITEAGAGELRLGDDVVDPRDRRRWELDPDSKDKE